jgi:hypothetical protein
VITWAQWPSGDSRPIAVFPYELAELADRYGLEYQEGVDDLGRCRLAAIQLGQGEQAWISKHDGDPNPGSVVFVDADSDVARAQSRLLKLFRIGRKDLLWAAPARNRLTARAGYASLAMQLPTD